MVKYTSNFLLALTLLVWQNASSAAISLGLTGASEKTTNSLEKTTSNQISANVSLGLGNHVLIGVTHRRAFEYKTGYKKASTNNPNIFVYIPYRDNGESLTNSLDLTIIPYNGLISPFIFGGVARRDYRNEIFFLDQNIPSKYSMFPIPNYGFGTAIQLGMGFQLKITQTYTPGIETLLSDTGEESTRIVKDSYTQVWVGYKL